MTKRPGLNLVALALACLTAACTAHLPSASVAPRPNVSSGLPTVAGSPAEAPTGTSTPDTATEPGLPSVISHGPRDRARVALTFDSNMTDGMLARLNRHQVPSYDNREVIDELEGLGVPATMFLAGKWIERYPDETRRLAASPLFELASHSYAHRAFHTPCYGLPAIGQAGMAADVERSERLLAQFTDHPTRYFRFPGGCYDGRALQAIASAGVVVIQFDVASGDAFGHSVPAIVSHVLGSVRNGSIVVMHITDGDTAPLTAKALPPVVEGLRARGYELVWVSTLLSATKPSTSGG